MAKKHRPRPETKSINPRSNVVVKNMKGGTKNYQFKLNTDYDQRLWSPPKVEKHGTG